MSNTNTSKYTYTAFAHDIINIANGELELNAELAEKIKEKASDLLATQEAKAKYNAEHKTSKAKGASEKTKALSEKVKAILSATPITSAEMSAILGDELTPLQIANACRFIEGVQSTKVIRDTVNSKGLKMQKEYTAYFIK
ncbi:MAG: hypothetical protein KBT46_00400 [Ruminococcus sp.]|nr:hypothetical protein [Candidatus Copronaster equi]